MNPEAERILADMRAEMYAHPDDHFPDMAAARAMAEFRQTMLAIGFEFGEKVTA